MIEPAIGDLLAPLSTGGAWGSPVEVERKRRIDVAAWAYAYEVDGDPLVSDATFDQECLRVRPEMATGNATLDQFFREEFSPSTGMWVHMHPGKNKLRRIVRLKRKALKQGAAP